MSVKSTFLALKKVVQFVPIEGRGGGGGIFDKSKRTAAFFFRKPSPMMSNSLFQFLIFQQ